MASRRFSYCIVRGHVKAIYFARKVKKISEYCKAVCLKNHFRKYFDAKSIIARSAEFIIIEKKGPATFKHRFTIRDNYFIFFFKFIDFKQLYIYLAQNNVLFTFAVLAGSEVAVLQLHSHLPTSQLELKQESVTFFINTLKRTIENRTVIFHLQGDSEFSKYKMEKIKFAKNEEFIVIFDFQ